MADKNWRETTFGECALINDSTYSPKEDWPFINYLDTGNITENRVDQIQHLVGGQDKIPSRARRKVQPGDIVYSTVRPNQRHFGILKELPANFLASTGFAVIRGNGDTSETDYLYYFLSQDHIVDHLHTIAEHSTSAYPSIKPSDIASLELSLPPLDEQRRIAHILGTLDDKIELNRRMSATLEAMAQALFKSWFVDFDPVRAKAEGRPIGLPPNFDALFPDSFQDSELGEIPFGWEVGRLADYFHLTMGQSPPGSTYNEDGEGLPFFQGSTDFGFRYPTYRKFCTEPKRIANAGDTLVSVRAPVGDINMASEKCCIGRGLAALRHKARSSSYTYHAARALRERFKSYDDNGTVFGAINKGQFGALPVVEPPAALIGAFDRSFDGKIAAMAEESNATTRVRDTLLPYLLTKDDRDGDVG